MSKVRVPLVLQIEGVEPQTVYLYPRSEEKTPKPGFRFNGQIVAHGKRMQVNGYLSPVKEKASSKPRRETVDFEAALHGLEKAGLSDQAGVVKL